MSLFILIGGVFIGYNRFKGAAGSAAKNNEQEQVQGLETTQQSCSFSESIEYYYYDTQDPAWQPNNKVGLYIYAENEKFLERADELVNSSGGDWGYVLIPYNTQDYDFEKWGRVFEQLSDNHLIPSYLLQMYNV